MLEVRGALAGDIPALQEIEVRACEAFRDVGMDQVADDDPFSAEELQPYLDAGRAWVAAPGDGPPVAYLLVDEVDGAAHIEQVSVDPDFARQRVGLRLIEAMAAWARRRGFTRMTLTTFAEVAWNAPWYERCGFRVLPEQAWTPGLVAIRQREAAQGLDAWPRVCMERDLTDGGRHGRTP